MSKAVILSAVRTPVGRRDGALSETRPDDLAAIAIEAAVSRAGVPAGEAGIGVKLAYYFTPSRS